MLLLQYKTRREILGDWLTNFFESIGVDPMMGFLTILFIILAFRIRSFVKQRKAKEKYKGLEIFEDLLLVSMIVFGIYLFGK